MKKYIVPLFILILIIFAVTMQNCNGTRVRDDNLNVSSATVNAQLAAIQSAGVSSLDSGSQTDFNSFFTMLSAAGSTLYYAEAPGSMGSIPTVMPLNFPILGVTQPPAKAYAYFVYAADNVHGALMITTDGAAPAAAAGTTTTPSTTTPAAAQTPIIAMANDGTINGVPPGSFSDTDFTLPLDFQGTSNVILDTQDVVDGSDLADTIEFELFNPASDGSSDATSLGTINLTTPLD